MRGKFELITLVPGFRVDTKLLNPVRPQDFKIRNKVVTLPKDCLYPFAILSGSDLLQMWTSNETHLEHIVNALQSFYPPL